MPNPTNTSSPYLTVKQTAGKHPAFSEGALRWAIFNRHANGFDACLIRIGRRLLIDEFAFLAWVAKHREARPPGEGGEKRP